MAKGFAGLESELHAAASRVTGLDDFGDPAYREGLRVLLQSFHSDMQLTETGRRFVYDCFLLAPLIARLYTEKAWAEHPEVLRIAIQQPLIITGFPRTGTTALHRLLCLDPQFQGLQYWLTQAPMIRPPRDTWERNSAYQTCVCNLEATYFANMPDVRKAHDFAPSEVEECGGVLSQSFMFSGFARLLPMYARWYFTQSAHDSYRRYVNVLRLIGGHEPEKRWLLKGPDHMVDIETLMEVFPDACIIQTHRDPLEAIPSFCSGTYMMQHAFEGAAARTDVLGPRQCRYWRNALDRIQATRQKRPGQFFDVNHRRFLLDPLGTVRSIYGHFGLTLSSSTVRQMREWIAASPTTRHGEHRYTIKPYGITEGQICEIFKDYRLQHQFT